MPRPDQKDAMLVFPSCIADTTGARGCHYITGVAAAGSFAIPQGMKGKFVRLTPYGGGVQAGVSFGAAGRTLVWNQASAPGTGHADAGEHADDSGGPRWLEGIVPADATFMNYVNETGKTITLRVFCSEARPADLVPGDDP